MFFIHGGANVIGASNEEIYGGNLYDGEALARDRDVVVVTTNYRLGAFGFMVHPALASGARSDDSGNYATLDQIAALQWVKHNIGAFGGDPSRVMIFGESAGALNTCVLLASPLAKGLFASALMESGECTSLSRGEAERRGHDVAAGVGCAGDDVGACLRGKSAADLAFVPTHVPNLLAGWDLFYAANVDGLVLDAPPLSSIQSGASTHVPFVIGSNAHETELFIGKDDVKSCADYDRYLEKTVPSLKDEVARRYPCSSYAFPRWAAVAASTDMSFTCPARRIARAAAANGVPTHRYLYTHVRDYGSLSFLRAFHAAELAFVFRTYDLDPMGHYVATLGEMNLSSQIQGYWSSLAKSGDPNPSTFALPWPQYERASEQLLVLDEAPILTDDQAAAACDFWDSVVPPG
jgi:para-nitrobenzyl esterase